MIYVDGQVQGVGGGGGAGLSHEAAHGFAAATNFFGGPVGTITGVAGGFSASVAGYLRRKPSTREFMFGTYSQFVNGGWALGVDANRFKLMLTQASDGSKLENFVDAAYTDIPWVLGKLFVLHFVWDGTVATLYVQGDVAATITPTSGITFDATLGPHLGVESRNQAEAFSSGAILGAAYGTQVMTADEVADHYFAVEGGAAMVDDPATGFDNLWSLDGESAAPATLADQIGAVDLTLTGALTMEARSSVVL